jgi:hypothetical protein
MNKDNIIRLTENELKEIIKESVRQIIEESGETLRGQWKMGKAARRQEKRGNYDRAEGLKDYALQRSADVLRSKRKGGEIHGHYEFEDELMRDLRDASFSHGYEGTGKIVGDVLRGMKKHSAFADL